VTFSGAPTTFTLAEIAAAKQARNETPPHSYNESRAMIEYLYLGRVAYDEALRLQEELIGLRYAGRVDNVLLLLEHPPVLTLGRNASRANVLASDELLAARGVTLHEINRGGDVTYHGPGQLVGYPIFDLRSLRNARGGRLGPVDFVRLMEEVLIGVCGAFQVGAGRIAGLTGVWCRPADGGALDESSAMDAERAPSRKIAAIGIHVSRGITSHGFAFNVTTDLRDFRLINPCGITDRPVTSLERELDRELPAAAQVPSLEAVAHEAARQFGFVFGEQVLAVENLDELRTQAAHAGAAPELPAEDTPMSIPPKVERLRGAVSRPSRA
jgi:lipoyl(octanoyl) transferase